MRLFLASFVFLLLVSNNAFSSDYYQKAVSARNSGDMVNAEKYIDMYVKKFPKNNDAINMQALIKGGNGKLDEAINIVEKALENKKDDKQLMVTEVRLFIWQNNFVKAKEKIDNLIKKYPDDAEIKNLNKTITDYNKSKEGKWFMSVEGSTSWFKDHRKKWYEGSVEVKKQYDTGYGFFRITDKRRYSLNNQLYVLGLGKKFEGNRWLTFEGATSPSADFVERYYFKMGASSPLYDFGNNKINSLSGAVNTSYKMYKTDILKSIEPSLTLYLMDNRVWFTSTYILSKAQSKADTINGQKFQLDFQVTKNITSKIGGSYAPEVDNGTLYEVRNRYLGVSYKFSEDSALSDISFALNRETRINYKRYDATINLSFRF